jgi:uncharacterized membrane protein (DUF485 family)
MKPIEGEIVDEQSNTRGFAVDVIWIVVTFVVAYILIGATRKTWNGLKSYLSSRRVKEESA